MKKILLLTTLFLITSKLSATVGAGILPYAYKDGKAYFLLGKEQGRWNDFSGSCDKTEDDTKSFTYSDGTVVSVSKTEYCAAREASEETGFAYGNGNKKKSMEFFIKKIKNKKRYVDNIKGNITAHRMFFVEVPYKKIDTVSIWKNPQPSKNSQEKSAYAWVRVDSLYNATKNFSYTGGNNLNTTLDGKQFTIFGFFASLLQKQPAQQSINEILSNIPTTAAQQPTQQQPAKPKPVQQKQPKQKPITQQKKLSDTELSIYTQTEKEIFNEYKEWLTEKDRMEIADRVSDQIEYGYYSDEPTFEGQTKLGILEEIRAKEEYFSKLPLYKQNELKNFLSDPPNKEIAELSQQLNDLEQNLQELQQQIP